LKDDGTIWNWGGNYSSQLGDSTNMDRYEPVKVSGLNGVTAISAGFMHTLALKDDGTVWSWGWNHRGQLGDGTKNYKSGFVTVIEGQRVTNDIAETNTKIKEVAESIKKLPTTTISMFKGWSLEIKGLAFSIGGFFVVAILLIIKKMRNFK